MNLRHPQFRRRSNKLILPNKFFLISWVQGSFIKCSRRYEDLVIVFSVSSISPTPIMTSINSLQFSPLLGTRSIQQVLTTKLRNTTSQFRRRSNELRFSKKFSFSFLFHECGVHFRKCSRLHEDFLIAFSVPSISLAPIMRRLFIFLSHLNSWGGYYIH